MPNPNKQEEKYIMVIGRTGAGMSTFIKTITGQEVKIGNDYDVRSCTTDIQSIKVQHPSRSYPVVFIDTPGFDHTTKPDTEIVNSILDGFKKVYKNKAVLAGIIYLHRISDNRVDGSLRQNFELLACLCGRKAMPRVIIVTTHWARDKAGLERGKKREDELKQEFWKDMRAAGCGTEPFQNADDSDLAWKIANIVLEKKCPEIAELKITEAQEEIKQREVGILGKFFGLFSKKR